MQHPSGPVIKLSRQALYALVWSKPITEISKELGVTQLGFAKLCDYYDVARPPAGYWQKIAFGKKVEITQLGSERFEPHAIVELKRSRDPTLRGGTSRTISA